MLWQTWHVRQTWRGLPTCLADWLTGWLAWPSSACKGCSRRIRAESKPNNNKGKTLGFFFGRLYSSWRLHIIEGGKTFPFSLLLYFLSLFFFSLSFRQMHDVERKPQATLDISFYLMCLPDESRGNSRCCALRRKPHRRRLISRENRSVPETITNTFLY